MDSSYVALASVITSAGTTVWVSLQSRRAQREDRRQRRLADAYVEVLDYVEREAAYVAALDKNWQYTTWDEWERPPRLVVQAPDAGDRARERGLSWLHSHPQKSVALSMRG